MFFFADATMALRNLLFTKYFILSVVFHKSPSSKNIELSAARWIFCCVRFKREKSLVAIEKSKSEVRKSSSD